MRAHRPPSETELRRGELLCQRPNAEHARAERPRMRLVSWKPIVKGSLRGFATVELPSGLRIADCPVLFSAGKAWSTLPSKPVLDREGRQVEVSGKKQYVGILEWKSRDLADRFSNAVVALVLQTHPDALGDGAP